MDATAFGADAGPDRVHVPVARGDCNLAPPSGLPRNRFDLDDTLIDLGHLKFKQPLEKPRVRARHDDLGAAGALTHLDHIRFDAFALPIALPRDLLCGRQHGFDTAQVKVDILALDALHCPSDDVAFSVPKLFVDEVPFGLSQPLDDHLFGGLGRDAPKVARGDLDFHHVADFRGRIPLLRFG